MDKEQNIFLIVLSISTMKVKSEKKLIGVAVNGTMSDDWILNTLLSKSRDMKNKNKSRSKI